MTGLRVAQEMVLGIGGVRALRALGIRVEHLEADFSEPTASMQLMAAAVQAFGHIDVLVANAGISAGTPPGGGVEPGSHRPGF